VTTGLEGAHSETHATAGHSDEAVAIHHTAHNLAMLISVLVAGLGILIATLAYYWKRISPALWQTRFGVVYRGMFHKWWIDEVYDVTAVRGVLGISKLLAWFDLTVIDGIVDGSATLTRLWSTVSGWFDLHVVDGMVNLTAWIFGVWGKGIRVFQTGQLQRYILYTLIAIGLFLLLNVFPRI
jgi:NADH-quinone oxidoreductase subunit L